eukprot:2888199-Rhodomonas_salina.1
MKRGPETSTIICEACEISGDQSRDAHLVAWGPRKIEGHVWRDVASGRSHELHGQRTEVAAEGPDKVVAAREHEQVQYRRLACATHITRARRVNPQSSASGTAHGCCCLNSICLSLFEKQMRVAMANHAQHQHHQRSPRRGVRVECGPRHTSRCAASIDRAASTSHAAPRSPRSRPTLRRRRSPQTALSHHTCRPLRALPPCTAPTAGTAFDTQPTLHTRRPGRAHRVRTRHRLADQRINGMERGWYPSYMQAYHSSAR